MAVITSSMDQVFTKSILLTHKDVIFQVSVDSETEELLKNDEKRRKEYAKHIYETCLTEQPNESADAEKTCDVLSESSSMYQEDAASCSSNLVQFQGLITNDTIAWSPKNTLLLVRTRLAMEEEFSNPRNRNRKAKLWEKVAEVMQANGFKVSPELCDSKWRNLLQTYRRIKEKGSKGQNTWAFYGVIDKVLGKKVFKSPPTMFLASSLDVPESSSESNPEPPVKRKKISNKKKVVQGPEWFISMIRKLDAREARAEAWEKKKTLIDNERWNIIFSKLEETRKLEREKLEALKKLEITLTNCLENNKECDV